MCCKKQKTHTHLPLQDKINILEALKKGTKGTTVAKLYNVTPAAISNLKKNKDRLLGVENINLKVLKKRKVIKPVHNIDLEKSLIMWFNERRSLGEPVSGPLFREKALILNYKLNGAIKFKASNCWLDKFKRRHGIRQLSMQGEKLSADVDAAIKFAFDCQNLVNEEGYDLSLLFNADESGIYWRRLPLTTLAGANEEHDCPGWKLNKDRLSALFCANADGTFALPLLVIGKSQNPRCFKDVGTLPVIYKHQKSAWMNGAIFFDWYKNRFIPSVQEMQEKTKKFGKVLLLLDNAKCHPPKEVHNKVNENFTVEYLPPNVTSLIQPMDQGVIAKAKNVYRKHLLRQLILNNDKVTIPDFLKTFNLRDCCLMLANAFEALTQDNLKNAWNKLRGVSGLNENNDVIDKSSMIKEVHSLVEKVKDFEEIHPSAVNLWLSEDEYDQGWKPLSDDEIVEEITGQKYDSIENKRIDERKILESYQAGTNKELNNTIYYLHNWCMQNDQYTLSDFRVFRKWEDISLKELQKEHCDSPDLNNNCDLILEPQNKKSRFL